MRHERIADTCQPRTTSATAAAARAVVAAGRSKVQGESAPVNLGAVEAVKGGLGLLDGGEVDKPESAAD